MLARLGYWASLFGGMGGRDDRDRGGGGIVGLLMLILAPIAATLIQLAVSRSREYQADATGAQLTGNPYALASALKKLDAYSKRIPMRASPSNAHLFIVAPLLSGVSFANLFSTHPPIAKRIERLTGRPAELDSTSRSAEESCAWVEVAKFLHLFRNAQNLGALVCTAEMTETPLVSESWLSAERGPRETFFWLCHRDGS